MSEQSITARRSSSTDDLYTPYEAYKPISDFVKQYDAIWECCCGDGHLVEYMSNDGATVIATDIRQGLHHDCRLAAPPNGASAIVTNPPYSIRKDVVTALIRHDLPTALLMPTNTLNRPWMQHLTYNLLPLYKRVRFVGQPTSAPFDVTWFIFNATKGDQP